MSLIMTERRLKTSNGDSFWATLIRGERWFVAAIELDDGKRLDFEVSKPNDTEGEALALAAKFVDEVIGCAPNLALFQHVSRQRYWHVGER